MIKIFCNNCKMQYQGKFDPIKCPICNSTDIINKSEIVSEMDREEACWQRGTGYGDCSLCSHSFECSGSRDDD